MMTPVEVLDAEFYTRIAKTSAQWFVDRRNRRLFEDHSSIQTFLSELQIPFPVKNPTLFWTIVYFARRLIFPQSEQHTNHLQEWLGQCKARCFSSKKNLLKRPYITIQQGDKEITYSMPIELYYTPALLNRSILPPIETTTYEEEEETDE